MRSSIKTNKDENLSELTDEREERRIRSHKKINRFLLIL